MQRKDHVCCLTIHKTQPGKAFSSRLGKQVAVPKIEREYGVTKLFNCFRNQFTCEVCGEKIDLKKWNMQANSKDVLVIDSLTGLAGLIEYAVVGNRAIDQQDWGEILKNWKELAWYLLVDWPGHIYITGHLQTKEQNGIQYSSPLFAGNGGKSAFYPNLDDIFLASKSSKEFIWDTSNSSLWLSTNRFLNPTRKLTPDYAHVHNAWLDQPENQRTRGAKILVYGESGTGKTHAIKTILEAGLNPVVIFTENSHHTLTKVGTEFFKTKM